MSIASGVSGRANTIAGILYPEREWDADWMRGRRDSGDLDGDYWLRFIRGG